MFKNVRFGMMANRSRWYNYLKPRPLMLSENATSAGYQQYRWLNFYITLPV